MKVKQQKYQVRIVSSIVGFVLIALLVFGLVLPWFNTALQGSLAKILEQKKTVLELRQEQHNIELAKQDLVEIEKKERLPENFFSKDTTLVTDLGSLEGTARDLRIEFSLSISGTVPVAAKAKTTSELFLVPFTIQLSGAYADVISYFDFLEHSGTVFTVQTINLGSGDVERVTANLGGSFYLRK